MRLIPYSVHNKWYQSQQFVRKGYGTVYVYGTIHLYSTVHVYGIIHVYDTVHEYGRDDHLYLRDSLL